MRTVVSKKLVWAKTMHWTPGTISEGTSEARSGKKIDDCICQDLDKSV